MQRLPKPIKKSPNGENKRKDIEQKKTCKTEKWMLTEYNERVLDCWKMAKGNYTNKLKQYDNTMV